MIKKRVMLLASLLLISCLSGCNGIGFFKGDNVEEHTIAIQDVHKGTEGLVMSFLEDAPPDEVFEDSNSVIGLKLENRGACDIKDGYLSLSFDTQYMTIEYILQSTFGKGFDLKNPSFSLGGKSVSNLEGEEGMVIFSTKTSSLDGREMHSSNIAAVACYNYKTEAAETVCIDSDIYNVKKTVKSCSVEDIDLTGQGAPVAVTRIEPRMITKDDKTIPMFMITIENKDDGLVVDKDKTKKACTADKFKEGELNKLYVNAYLSGEKKLTCKPDVNEQFLKENKAEIVCEYSEGIGKDEGTFMALLTIEIEYGYTKTISEEIKIKERG